MALPISERIADHVSLAVSLYYRLILVVGPPRTGKTTSLRDLAAERSWPMVNVNLSLSERLLELTSRQRALKVAQILQKIANEHRGDVLLLDNIEVLFSPDLNQNPLLLLQNLSRNRTVIAAWAGEQDGENLTYAIPSHSEFTRYYKPDVIIVPTVEAKDADMWTEM